MGTVLLLPVRRVTKYVWTHTPTGNTGVAGFTALQGRRVGETYIYSGGYLVKDARRLIEAWNHEHADWQYALREEDL